MTRPRILSITELATLPPPRYLLEPFIIDGGLTVLFGASGTYKSFVALDWALRVAVESSALYVAAEGAAGMGQRVKAWQDHGPAGSDPRISFIAGNPVNLLKTGDIGELLAAIGELDHVP